MTEQEQPKKTEVKFFRGLNFDVTRIQQKDELLEWEEKVVKFKKSILGNISPEGNAFTGRISVENEGEVFTFFWRSWMSFTRKYRTINGKAEDTGWAPVTFCVELPDSRYEKKAGECARENYGAIWCAIIETCESERKSKLMNYI